MKGGRGHKNRYTDRGNYTGTEKFTYNMYIQQHVKGYTKTHVGWYKVLKQRKRYIDTSNYICTVKQLHTICTDNNKREGTGYMVKHRYGNIGSPQKPHTPPPRIARRKPLTEEAPPDHSGRAH